MNLADYLCQVNLPALCMASQKEGSSNITAGQSVFMSDWAKTSEAVQLSMTGNEKQPFTWPPKPPHHHLGQYLHPLFTM